MKGLLFRVFDSDHYYKIDGLGWLDTEEYDLTGKIPDSRTKEQFRAMLQNLLVERFHLASHHETRDLPSYELVVAKRGPKLKEATYVETDAAVADKTGPRKLDANGFPVPDRANMAMRMNAQAARLTAKAQTVSRLANLPGGQHDGRVVDKSGLAGRYDFTLEFVPSFAGAAPPNVDSLPPLETALQKQLGLRLGQRNFRHPCFRDDILQNRTGCSFWPGFLSCS